MSEYEKGTTIHMTPDKALPHGSKLRLVDMKKSLYRVEENFNDTKLKKAVDVTFKNTDKK